MVKKILLVYRNVLKTSDEQKLNFLKWNLEIWVFFTRAMVDISIDRTNKHSNRCVDNNYDSKRINFFLSIFAMYFTYGLTKQWSGCLPEVENPIENSKTVSRKSGRGGSREVAFTRGSSIRLWLDIFGVLGRWSLMGGGRLREVVARGGATVLRGWWKSVSR